MNGLDQLLRDLPPSISAADSIILDVKGGIGGDIGIAERILLHLREGGIPSNVSIIGEDFVDDAPRLKNDLLEVDVPEDIRRKAQFSQSDVFLLDKCVIPDELSLRIMRGDQDVEWITRLVDPQQLERVLGAEASRLPSISRAIFALSVLYTWPYARKENLHDFFIRHLRAAANRTKGTIYIYCVGGLAGGTFSGLSIPSAILWRHLARREGLRVSCRAFVIAGDYRGRDGQQDQREATSANMLFELERTTDPNIRYELPVRRDVTFSAQGPLFDSIVVNEAAGKVAGDTRAVVNIAAHTLFFSHFVESGAAATKNATNVEDRPRVLALTGGSSNGEPPATRSELHKFFVGGSRAVKFGVADDLSRSMAVEELLEMLTASEGSVRDSYPVGDLLTEANENGRRIRRAFQQIKSEVAGAIDSSLATSDATHPRFEERLGQSLQRRIEETAAGGEEERHASDVAAHIVERLLCLPVVAAQQCAADIREQINARLRAGEERRTDLRSRLNAAESALPTARPRREATPQPNPSTAFAVSGVKNVLMWPGVNFGITSLATLFLLWLSNDSFGLGSIGLAAISGVAIAYLTLIVQKRRRAEPAPSQQQQTTPRTARFATGADRFRQALRSVWELRCDATEAEVETTFARDLLISFDEHISSTIVSPTAQASLSQVRVLLAHHWQAMPEGPLVRLHPGAVVFGGREGSMLVRRVSNSAGIQAQREREVREAFRNTVGKTLEEALNSDPDEQVAVWLITAVAKTMGVPPLHLVLSRALAEVPRLADDIGRCIVELQDVAMEGLRLRHVPDPVVCWHNVTIFVPEKAASSLVPIIESHLPSVTVTSSHDLSSVVMLAAARNMPLKALADFERLREAANRMDEAERRSTIEYPASLRVRNRKVLRSIEKNNGFKAHSRARKDLSEHTPAS